MWFRTPGHSPPDHLTYDPGYHHGESILSISGQRVRRFFGVYECSSNTHVRTKLIETFIGMAETS